MYPVQAPRRCSATHEAQRRDPSERFDRRSGWDWQGPSPQGGASWLTPEAPRPLQSLLLDGARPAPPAPIASTPAVPARPRRALTQARRRLFGASPRTDPPGARPALTASTALTPAVPARPRRRGRSMPMSELTYGPLFGSVRLPSTRPDKWASPRAPEQKSPPVFLFASKTYGESAPRTPKKVHARSPPVDEGIGGTRR